MIRILAYEVDGVFGAPSESCALRARITLPARDAPLCKFADRTTCERRIPENLLKELRNPWNRLVMISAVYPQASSPFCIATLNNAHRKSD